MPAHRRSISVTLESVNCVAREANSVPQAEAILERESFDLVILDKHFPGGQTGMEFLPRLIARGLRVVVITGAPVTFRWFDSPRSAAACPRDRSVMPE